MKFSHLDSCCIEVWLWRIQAFAISSFYWKYHFDPTSKNKFCLVFSINNWTKIRNSIDIGESSRWKTTSLNPVSFSHILWNIFFLQRPKPYARYFKFAFGSWSFKYRAYSTKQFTYGKYNELNLIVFLIFSAPSHFTVGIWKGEQPV